MTLRTDRSSLVWSPEPTTYGLPSGIWSRFGLVESAILPDPTYTPYPYYSVLRQRRSTIIKGKEAYIGSIPDIKLQSMAFLGTCLYPLNDDVSPASFSISSTLWNTVGGEGLTRIYGGGRIGKATLSLREGEEVRFSIDEMQFIAMAQSRLTALRSGAQPVLDPGAGDGSVWTFAGATITCNGVILSRVRGITITIDNNLYPYYGIREADSIDNVQSPSRILVGKVGYKLNLISDIVDETDFSLWDYMFNQWGISAGSPATGVTVNCVLQRIGGDSNAIITCGIAPVATNPGVIFEKLDMPMAVSNSGVYTANISADVDSISITFS